jgi:hypothetical protein
MKECFWLANKECPYLQQEKYADNPFMTVEKKDLPMLQHFEIEEICHNCLLATKINMGRHS